VICYIGTMPMQQKYLGSAGLAFVLLIAVVRNEARESTSASPSNVAIVHAAAWSQGDAAREGASELVVLLEIARLRQHYPQGGVVAVGDRRGLFSTGAEEALRQAVLQGVPVVKLANRGRVLQAPHGLFLDGGTLSENEAKAVLDSCIERYGVLPAAAGDATGEASQKLRARLQLFQHEFALAAGMHVATR
jgi:hypothetical protein